MNPLLLLHGAIGCQTQFDQIKKALPDSFEAHTLDFEGHGQAEMKERPFSIPHFAENVVAYLDGNGIETADIFGHSMGGYVGLHLAQTAPERVGKIFTLGTKFDWTPEFAAREIRNMDADRMVEKVPQFAKTLEERHVDWRENLAKSREMTKAMGENPPLTLENLATVNHLVRVGIGDQDRMVTIDETVEVFRVLPNGQLHVLPATPHPLERVDEKRIALAIEDFFS